MTDDEPYLDADELSRLAMMVAKRLHPARGQKLFPRDVRAGDRWLPWHFTKAFQAKTEVNERVLDAGKDGAPGDGVHRLRDDELARARRYVWRTDT